MGGGVRIAPKTPVSGSEIPILLNIMIKNTFDNANLKFEDFGAFTTLII